MKEAPAGGQQPIVATGEPAEGAEPADRPLDAPATPIPEAMAAVLIGRVGGVRRARLIG